jgi:hypothetical protein
MKARKDSLRSAAVTPESAVWMLYAGLCDGLRWQRHVARIASDDARPTLARVRARTPRG